jgi:arylsulfatase A-like enzyme
MKDTSDGDPLNVLVLFTDDQRHDTIAALGNPHLSTPNMDGLASAGTAFVQARIMGGSCPAVCMPSRAMLHTGRTLYGLQDLGQDIPDEHVTLAECFRAAGYDTFGTGKWHNGSAAFARGFTGGDEIFFGGMTDHWNMPAYHFDPSGRYDACLPYCPDFMRSREIREHPADHMTPGRHSTDLIAAAAIRFLRERKPAAPFFAYVSFLAPHDPRVMPAAYLRRYDPDTIPLPPNFMGGHPFDNGEVHVRDELLESWPRTPPAIRRHLAEYYAMISHIDDRIGDILRALDESGAANRTVIVFAGDNGLALGQHGLMGKQSLYEHSVRVPLILSGPGVPRGQRRASFCYLSDVFPTLCEMTGLDVPDSVEGRSLCSALADPAHRVRDLAYGAYRHVQRSVHDGRLKLIRYEVDGRRTTQLFDMRNDPWEIHNLADAPAHHADRGRLEDALTLWRTDFGDTTEQGRAFWSAENQAHDS